MIQDLNDTIVALSTPPGQGAIGVIRLSGIDAIKIVDRVFYGKNLMKVEGHTAHYGKIKDEQDNIYHRSGHPIDAQTRCSSSQ